MALPASTIVDQAACDLNDIGHAYWPESELLEYLNDGQRAAVLLRPEVNPAVADLPLINGVLQNFSSLDGAYILLDVNCIKIQSGADYVPSAVVTPVRRKDLDNIDPQWRNVVGTTPPDENATGYNYIYDLRNRKTFYLYHADSAIYKGLRAEIVYSKIPATLTATNSNLAIDDIYAPALLAYVMHRARAKDLPIEGQGAQLSMLFYQKFVSLITGEQPNDNVIRIESVEQPPTQ